MAVTALLYGKLFANCFGGETAGESVAIDLLSDTIKVALTTSSYTPNQDTHEFFDAVTNEITGTGYTAGGATLGSKTLAYASKVSTFDAADTSWTTSTLTARYAVVYKDTGTASTSPLICYINFGADVSTTAGTFLITWNASGIFTVTVA